MEKGERDKEINVTVTKVIDSSLELRSKRELIRKFIEKITPQANIYAKWQEFVQAQKEIDLKEIIADEKLKDAETRKFIQDSFRNGVLETIGKGIDDILPPIPVFGAGRQDIKKRVIKKLLKYFETYYDLFNDVA